MDQEVQYSVGMQHLDKQLQHCHVNYMIEGNKICSDHEHDSEVAKTSEDCCSTNVANPLLTKYSSYPNGATRLTDSAVNVCNKSDYNCELSLQSAESNSVDCDMSSTAQQTARSTLQLHACNNEATRNGTRNIDDAKLSDASEVISGELSVTEEYKQSSVDSEDRTNTLLNTHAVDNRAVEIDRFTDVKENGCAEIPHEPSVTCQDGVQRNDRLVDSQQPLDFSVSGLAKSGVCENKKPLEKNVPYDKQKAYPKNDTKSDNYRPFARLLHDLGLELVREQVYRDLIDIQTVKDAKNQLEEREKGQLLKLVEAQERLTVRNAPYQLPTRRCSRCNFMSPSANVMTLHHQFGTVSRIDSEMHVCCLCCGQRGFRTRNTAQFMVHLSSDHGLTGRLMKKTAPYACKNCVFEHKSSIRLAAHLEKCVKKFSLSSNLQPLPGDCDIPLIYRPSDRKRPGASPFGQSNTLSNASFSATGPPSVRTLLSSARQQISPGYPGCSYNQLVMPTIICEICGKLVDSREALWGHFRSAHHVELCRTTMRDKEPWMKCDVCSGRFWTYQGLSRHLLLAHNRALATSFTTGTPVTPVVPRCHLCGGSQTTNPLSHFSAYHNVTLLEMYHAKLCCLCNRKVNSGRAFEEHMVEQHSDIFANYDVLRTVLQALTTARYFKADDTREPTAQSIKQLSARASQGADISSDARKKSVDNAQTAGQCRTYTAGDMADMKTVTPGSSQTLQNTHNSSGVVSPQDGQKKKLKTVMKHKCTTYGARKKPASPPETQISAVTSNSKGATAEEVKKLYEDLADIGRPILRSMRRKLSHNLQSEDSISDAQVQNNSITSEEIPAKKVQLQSTDEVHDEIKSTD